MNNQSLSSTKGCLYLVPTPLDFGCEDLTPIQEVMPLGSLQIASQLQYWITENAKSTRAFLNRVHPICPLKSALQELNIQVLPRAVHKQGDHTSAQTDQKATLELLKPALAGHNVGLCSEAGMPAIADPGSSFVRLAHDLGIEVKPLVGPISLMLALAASGLNGQNFAFVGYLPVPAADRLKRMEGLQNLALQTGQTQIVIETPYRNEALMQAFIQKLKPNIRLSISSGLTLSSMKTTSQLISQWRQLPTVKASELPTVFCFGPG